MVNQARDKACLSSRSMATEGPLFISDEDICPERAQRVDRRFRPGPKESLLSVA